MEALDTQKKKHFQLFTKNATHIWQLGVKVRTEEQVASAIFRRLVLRNTSIGGLFTSKIKHTK